MDTRDKDIPKVCVMMSTYNGERFLYRQIESILEQQGCYVELLVRDDGSNDGTIQILNKFQEQGKLKFYIGKNLGPAKSFMDLIDNAPIADYYAFSDQDDIWLSVKLKSAISRIKELESKDEKVLYFSNLTPVYDEEHVIKPKLLPETLSTEYYSLLIRGGWTLGCTEVFNLALLSFVKRQSRPKRMPMHDLWIAIIASAYGKVIYDASSYILYRQHVNNVVGAQLSFKQKWKHRIGRILKGRGDPIDSRARSMMEIFENNPEISEKIKEQTSVVANYNKNLHAKMKFVFKSEIEKESFKRGFFRFILIILGKE